MICGFFRKDGVSAPADAIERMLAGGRPAERAERLIAAQGIVGLGCASGGGPNGLVGASQLSSDTPRSNCVAWQGEIYNRAEVLRGLGAGDAARRLSDPDILLRLYDAHGLACVEKINGSFAFALFDHSRQELVLGRDRLGIETLYYHEGPNAVVFASQPGPIVAHPEVPRELSESAVKRFLLFGFNPAWDTFFRGVRKLRPGRLLVIGRTRVEKSYWSLSFRPTPEKSFPEYRQDLLELMKDSIRLRLPNSNSLGIFLSGGMDSSSVAGLTRAIAPTNLSTFSYRCLGRSFDESHYARTMAAHCGAQHHEVVFQPSDVCRMAGMVRQMDEPLCNAAITVATFLLGEAAGGKVNRVFSGDGGDELFGGHPVYAADRIGAFVDRVPSLFQRPFFGLLRALPDSDQKLSLSVKFKRFAESIQYPKELGTYRWRILYGPDELRSMVSSNGGTQGNGLHLFDDLLELMEEADGPDILSRSLYVDTTTEVGFYLRRMDLVRSFGVTPVFPLLDHRLFEYAATIPSRLKFQDASRTKVIQHYAMEGVLPDEIVHRKDKLGHSIPLKNWIRTDPTVKDFVYQTLSDKARRTRGLVDDVHVKRLWDDHQQSRHNNSHRLWTLTVLELWLRENNL